MKQTVKKIIVGIMAMATFTTFFTGCSSNQPESDISTSTSTSTSSELLPGTPVSDSQFSVQFEYWYDSIKSTFDNKFEPTGETLFSRLPIYRDNNGKEFIVSGREQFYTSPDSLPVNDMVRRLRKEVTGERYYATLHEPAGTIAAKFNALLEKDGARAPETYEERVSSDNKLTLNDSIEYKVFLNNIDTGLTYKTSYRQIELYPILAEHQLAWFKNNGDGTAILRLFTGTGNVEIEIAETPEGLLEFTYPGKVEHGYANKLEFGMMATSFGISPDKIQTLLGYDIDVYSTYINIVTDNKDLVDDGCDVDEDQFYALIDAALTKQAEDTTPTPDPEPAQSTSSSTDPEPIQSSSTTTTPKPTQSSSSTSTSTSTSKPDPKPTPTQSSSTSSSFSSQPSTDPVTRSWNPNAPGNKPGPYGGYYDASGNLHCKKANMPRDEHRAPLISYTDEYGTYIMTYAEKQKAREEERRISAGGQPDDGLTDEEIKDLWGDLI